MAKDKNGVELRPGDIVTVTTKYRVLEVREANILAQKVYDVPGEAVTATGENVILEKL